MIRIHIKTLAGTTLSLELENDHHTTIETIKDLIKEKWGAPPDQQRLSYNGKQLQSDLNQSLKDYFIPSEATLRLTLRLGISRPTTAGQAKKKDTQNKPKDLAENKYYNVGNNDALDLVDVEDTALVASLAEITTGTTDFGMGAASTQRQEESTQLPALPGNRDNRRGGGNRQRRESTPLPEPPVEEAVASLAEITTGTTDFEPPLPPPPLAAAAAPPPPPLLPFPHPQRRRSSGMPGQFPHMPPQAPAGRRQPSLSPAGGRQPSFGNMPGGHQGPYSHAPPMQTSAATQQQHGTPWMDDPTTGRQTSNSMPGSHQQMGMLFAGQQHDSDSMRPPSNSHRQNVVDSSRRWQSDTDTPHRREMIQHIVKVLRKDKNGSPASLDKLPKMAKQLEVSLYRNARSFEAYMDISTLKARLQQIPVEVSRKAPGPMRSPQGGDNRDDNRHWTQRQQSQQNQFLNERGPHDSQMLRGSSSSSPFMDDINPMAGGGGSRGHSSSNNYNSSSRQGSSDQNQSRSSSGVLPHNRNDPEWKIRHKQQRLLLLHHSAKCPHEDGRCTVTPHCADMKRLWRHMEGCKDNNCRVSHCFSSRAILSHYRKCKDANCPVCGPARDTVKKSSQNRTPSQGSSRSSRGGLSNQPGMMNSNNSTMNMNMGGGMGTNSYQPGMTNIIDNSNNGMNIISDMGTNMVNMNNSMGGNQMNNGMGTNKGKGATSVGGPPASMQGNQMSNRGSLSPSINIAAPALPGSSPKPDSMPELTNPSFALNTQTQSIPSKLKSKCLEVLKGLQTHTHGWIFNVPVDPVELGIPDYFDIIKKPMDLGTIQKRLDSGSYEDIDKFAADANLTFDNAMTYNEEGSVVYDMAKELKAKFKIDYSELLSQVKAEDNEPLINVVAPATPGTSSKRNDSERQKVRHKQQRLLLLRHASRCQYEAGRCPVTPHCASMKKLWKHIAHCKDQHCSVQHCMGSRYVLSHYRRCKDAKCPVCGPVRETIRKSHEKEKNNRPAPGSMGFDEKEKNSPPQSYEPELKRSKAMRTDKLPPTSTCSDPTPMQPPSSCPAVSSPEVPSSTPSESAPAPPARKAQMPLPPTPQAPTSKPETKPPGSRGKRSGGGKQPGVTPTKKARIEYATATAAPLPLKQKAPTVDEGKPLTSSEQEKLTETINNMPPERIPGVIQIIRESKKLNGDEDEIDLNIDKLDIVTQRKLLHYVSKLIKPIESKSEVAVPAQPPELPHLKKPNSGKKSTPGSFFQAFARQDDSDSDSDDDEPPKQTASTTLSGGKHFSAASTKSDGFDDSFSGLHNDCDDDLGNGGLTASWNISQTVSKDTEKDKGGDDDDWGAARDEAKATAERNAGREAREKKQFEDKDKERTQRLKELKEKKEKVEEEKAREKAEKEKEKRDAIEAERAKLCAEATSVEQTVDLDAQCDIMKQYEQSFLDKELGSANPSDFGFDGSSTSATNVTGLPCLLSQQQVPAHQKSPMQVTNEKKATALLGVSVHWLKTGFMEEVRCAGCSDRSTIHDLEDLQNCNTGSCVIRNIGKNTICPVDGRIGAAYVHCLGNDIDKVGPATHMLSYSWGYAIGDIIETLWGFCFQNNLDPKRTYIWICCLCINQHRVVEQKVTGGTGMLNFEEEFPATLTKIGHMLAMMAPWHAPVYLTRIWCVFEVFAAHTRGCKIDIVMPPSEKQAMSDSLGSEGSQGINQLYRALWNTRVENAVATIEEDRDRILEMVESGPGCRELNMRVNDLLRHWVTTTSIEQVKLHERECCRNTKRGMTSQLMPKDAPRALLDAAVKPIERSMETSADVLTKKCTMVNDSATQDQPATLLEYRSAETVRETTESEVAHFVSNVGVLLHKNAETKEAIECHKTALNLYSFAGNLAGVAEAHSNMGSAMLSSGNLDEALEEHQRSLSIRESAFGMNSNESATSLNHIASVLLEKGNYDKALMHVHKAINILKGLGSDEDSEAAAMSHSIDGLVLLKQGNLNGALEHSQKALGIRELVLGIYHPDTATSYHNAGEIMLQMGCRDDAMEHLENALAIREYLLGSAHPETAESQKILDSVLVTESPIGPSDDFGF